MPYDVNIAAFDPIAQVCVAVLPHAVGAVNSVPHVGKSGNVLEVYVIRRSGGKLYAFPALVRVDQFLISKNKKNSRAICRNCRAACLCCSA